MSTMKSSEVSKTFGYNQPYAFPLQVHSETASTGIAQFAGYPDKADNKLEEKCAQLGIQVSSKELNELKTVQEFLFKHIKLHAICDVQCMLLWSEWVRFYRKQTRRIPELILEKEFRDLIVSQFGLSIAEDGFRGYIYPGIKYVP